MSRKDGEWPARQSFDPVVHSRNWLLGVQARTTAVTNSSPASHLIG